jgi:hypothetical protein
MDESVLRAMAKWPAVPNVYGWLTLDRRGNWLLKGDRIANAGITAFIGRNYASDDQGRWFFQNGPQRVFVALQYTPFVVGISAESPAALQAHTGLGVDRVTGAWVDETGSILVRWGAGIGVVDDRDLARILSMITDIRGQDANEDMLARALDPESRRHATGLYFEYMAHKVPIGRIHAGEVALKFGFDPTPRPAPGEPEC